MLYYKIIDLSEGIDPTMKSYSKEYMICHYFVCNHCFKFQYSISNGSHDLTRLSVNISNIAIIIIKGLIIVVLFMTLANSKHIIC